MDTMYFLKEKMMKDLLILRIIAGSIWQIPVNEYKAPDWVWGKNSQVYKIIMFQILRLVKKKDTRDWKHDYVHSKKGKAKACEFPGYI